MPSTDSALDHLEIGAAELLATAPDGQWTERQRGRLAVVHDYLKAAQYAHHKAEQARSKEGGK